MYSNPTAMVADDHRQRLQDQANAYRRARETRPARRGRPARRVRPLKTRLARVILAR
jgi:hypothetical protein